MIYSIHSYKDVHSPLHIVDATIDPGIGMLYSSRFFILLHCTVQLSKIFLKISKCVGLLDVLRQIVLMPTSVCSILSLVSHKGVLLINCSYSDQILTKTGRQEYTQVAAVRSKSGYDHYIFILEFTRGKHGIYMN